MHIVSVSVYLSVYTYISVCLFTTQGIFICGDLFHEGTVQG